MKEAPYPSLTMAQIESFAVKVQRAWHYDNYDAAEQAIIRERVAQLVKQNPRGYLAKHWMEVYR